MFAAGLLVSGGFAQQPATSGAPQSGNTPSPGTTGTQTDGATRRGQAGTAAHVAGAAGEGPMIGKPDEQFLHKAAMGGMMEVKLAKMAQEKASSDEVKEYARKLEQDHRKAADQIKQIAQQRGVTLPSDTGAPSSHDKQMQRLSGLSGDEFDRAFMRMQVQHHRKDVKEFQRRADRSMDSAVKDFASAQVPVLQEHLRQAEQLASSTATRTRKADKKSQP